MDIPHRPRGGQAPYWRTPAEFYADQPTGVLPEYRERVAVMSGGLLAYLCCAGGHELRCVKNNHTIGPEGDMNPSWQCTVPDCTFHVDGIRLLDWKG